jgi:Cap4 dsDNA endonuclease
MAQKNSAPEANSIRVIWPDHIGDGEFQSDTGTDHLQGRTSPFHRQYSQFLASRRIMNREFTSLRHLRFVRQLMGTGKRARCCGAAGPLLARENRRHGVSQLYMNANQPPAAPDEILASADPGDATAQRYQYQWTCAAIACCMLLDELEDVVEVFCEHHEDILLKHRDGCFTGQQIKTRDSAQPVWKTGDEAVRESCVRFARLESAFSGHFRRFRFLTNHPLYVKANGQDFPHVLGAIRDKPTALAVAQPALSFLKRVSKDAQCSEDVVHAALAKTEASDELPKLSDVLTRLVTTLTAVWAHAEHCTAPALMQAAERLAWACGRASSLTHEGLLPAYLPMSAEPAEAEMAARIDGKRITKDRLLELLEEGLNQCAPLHGDPAAIVPPGSGSGDLLLKKLDAGGFSAVSRNSAVDLRDKADYLGLVWTQKHGRTNGLQRYDHVRSVVLSDAARAYEATTTPTSAFGLNMLANLRSRFRDRRQQGTPLYDCSDEHLEGFAYSLTAQCHVQWSQDRPWESR